MLMRNLLEKKEELNSKMVAEIVTAVTEEITNSTEIFERVIAGWSFEITSIFLKNSMEILEKNHLQSCTEFYISQAIFVKVAGEALKIIEDDIKEDGYVIKMIRTDKDRVLEDLFLGAKCCLRVCKVEE